MLDDIGLLGYPTALVAPDGWHRTTSHGTTSTPCSSATAWKLGPQPELMADAARHRGVHLHLGRVDRWRRHEYAPALGCDSVDGALLRFDVAEWVAPVGRRAPALEDDR